MCLSLAPCHKVISVALQWPQLFTSVTPFWGHTRAGCLAQGTGTSSHNGQSNPLYNTDCAN